MSKNQGDVVSKPRKKQSKYYYNFGDKYPASRYGHTLCLPYGCIYPVPNNMGWLWTAKDVAGIKKPKGWRPGDIAKPVLKMMKFKVTRGTPRKDGPQPKPHIPNKFYMQQQDVLMHQEDLYREYLKQEAAIASMKRAAGVSGKYARGQSRDRGDRQGAGWFGGRQAGRPGMGPGGGRPGGGQLGSGPGRGRPGAGPGAGRLGADPGSGQPGTSPGGGPGGLASQPGGGQLVPAGAKLSRPESKTKSSKQAPQLLEPKPTLKIHRKGDIYTIQVHPLKDLTELQDQEDPYVDCDPLIFKIMKKRDPEAQAQVDAKRLMRERKRRDIEIRKALKYAADDICKCVYMDVYCNDLTAIDRDIERCPALEEPECTCKSESMSSISSNASWDIEYTPPFGCFDLSPRVRKEVTHMETQFTLFDDQPKQPTGAMKQKKKRRKRKCVFC